MSLRDMVDLIPDDEIIELGVEDGPVFNFDAPNEYLDGGIIANLRYAVAKSIGSLMFDQTKLYTAPAKIYNRIAFMLSDENVTSYADDLTQLEAYYSKSLYKKNWYTLKEIPMPGLNPGTVFRTRFRKPVVKL